MRIISGGQTGVDQGALRAARARGVETGGWAPKGWLTEDGPAPWLADFGLAQCRYAGYPARTKANVMAAHATLILADVADHSELAGGTKLTWDVACLAGRNGAGLFLADLRQDRAEECWGWLRGCMTQKLTPAGERAFVLNVAGPRESKSPGIGATAERFVGRVLDLVRAEEINRRNLNKSVRDLICPRCGKQDAERDRDGSDHPGAFRCRSCGEEFWA